MVLATAAGALRELLLRYDGSADAPLIASVPVALDTSPERLIGNECRGMNVSLPVHVEDPRERVRLTALAAGIRQGGRALLGPEVVTECGRRTCRLARSHRGFQVVVEARGAEQAVNVPISNVAGSAGAGRIGGATVSEIYSVGPLIAGSGMNITVWSYVDQLNISVLTDDLTLDDAHEATDAMMHAFTEIRSASEPSSEPTAVTTAMAPATAVG